MAACRRGISADPALIPAALELGIALQEAESAGDRQQSGARRRSTTRSVALQNAGRHLDRAHHDLRRDDRQHEQRRRSRPWKPNGRRASPPPTTRSLSTARCSTRIDALYQQRASARVSTRSNCVCSSARTINSSAPARPRRRNSKRGSARSTKSSPAKFAEFSRRLLADENTAIFITRRADLAGLPPNIVDAARRRRDRARACRANGRW